MASSLGGRVVMSVRIGQPVMRTLDRWLDDTYPRVASNWQHIARTLRSRNWLALPGTTSGLRIAVGRPLVAARFTATPAAYPPRPSTATGLCCRNRLRFRSLVSRQLVQNFRSPPTVLIGGTIGCGTNSKPVGARMVLSISRWVQRKTHLMSGAIARSPSATAIPGYRCPPVPPPARKIVLVGSLI